MSIRIGLCDDEAKFINLQEQYLKQFSVEFDVRIEVKSFNCAEDLISVLKEDPGAFDILFLDIDLGAKRMNGLTAAKSIREMGIRNVLFVFFTFYPEYMQRTFEVHTSLYLIKPIKYEEFRDNFKKLYNYHFTEPDKLTLELISGGVEYIRPMQIYYFESAFIPSVRHPLRIVTETRNYEIKCKFSDMVAVCEPYDFIMEVYRGVAINLKYIERLPKDGVSVVMKGGKTFPVSRSRSRELKHRLSDFLIK